jgi:hypothetical protein
MNKRMAAIIKMLSSTSDGEVVNAARMLGRMLKDNGKDWNDLGEYLSRWNSFSVPDPSTVVAPPRHTTTNSVRPGWERRATEQPVDRDLVKSQIEELMEGWIAKLNRKDTNFIEGLSDRFELYGERTIISPAQAGLVQSLYTQYVENKGRRR